MTSVSKDTKQRVSLIDSYLHWSKGYLQYEFQPICCIYYHFPCLNNKYEIRPQGFAGSICSGFHVGIRQLAEVIFPQDDKQQKNFPQGNLNTKGAT